MTDVLDRLERVVHRHVLNALPSADRAKRAGASLCDLLIDYLVWRGRFVAPVPRTVHRSPELNTDPNATQHQTVLSALETAMQQGHDLTPHLSRSVKRLGQDRLLADWGIHHLHLTRALESDGFMKRSGDVLFAAFTASDAYLLGIYDHPGHANWAAERIFATLVRNWPGSGLVHEMRGIVGISPRPTDEERRQLRNAGVASIMEIDGKVYVPGGFSITTAGTPTEATRRVHAVMWALRDWRQSDVYEQLRGIDGVSPGAYWVPAVHVVLKGFEEYAGFGGESTFVPVARIV